MAQAMVLEAVQIRQLLPVRPGEAYTVKDLPFTAVPAYNLGKPFHPRGNRWVGYVVTLEGRRVYVAGDTDDTPDARSVSPSCRWAAPTP